MTGRILRALALALVVSGAAAGPALAQARVLGPGEINDAMHAMLVDAAVRRNTGPDRETREKKAERDLARTEAEMKGRAATDKANSERRAESYKSARGAYDTAKPALKLGIDVAIKGAEFNSAYNALTPNDQGILDGVAKGAPQVPSACAEDARAKGGDGRCGECYRDAYSHLGRLRFNFEKLRAIGRNTENFVKKSIAFGDSASGVHGIAGIAWQSERVKIEQSLVDFNKIYDAKYDELITTADQVLHKIDTCEAQFMNNPDWYNRYGYIYFSFLQDRYRR